MNHLWPLLTEFRKIIHKRTGLNFRLCFNKEAPDDLAVYAGVTPDAGRPEYDGHLDVLVGEHFRSKLGLLLVTGTRDIWPFTQLQLWSQSGAISAAITVHNSQGADRARRVISVHRASSDKSPAMWGGLCELRGLCRAAAPKVMTTVITGADYLLRLTLEMSTGERRTEAYRVGSCLPSRFNAGVCEAIKDLSRGEAVAHASSEFFQFSDGIPEFEAPLRGRDYFAVVRSDQHVRVFSDRQLKETRMDHFRAVCPVGETAWQMVG